MYNKFKITGVKHYQRVNKTGHENANLSLQKKFEPKTLEKLICRTPFHRTEQFQMMRSVSPSSRNLRQSKLAPAQKLCNKYKREMRTVREVCSTSYASVSRFIAGLFFLFTYLIEVDYQFPILFIRTLRIVNYGIK